jgi:NADPH-dependent ferric siderophore reductase
MITAAWNDNETHRPPLERVRHDVKFRWIQVTTRVRLSPGMLRITFSGDELSDFVSLAPDDHLKIFLPTPTGEIERRDYTPRRFDPQARTLEIDFAIHDAGPATRWALAAQVGDKLQISGPKSSSLLPSDIQRWLLIGDETALPAIGRRIEEARAGSQITSLIAVSGPDEHQSFKTRAALAAGWIHRPLSAAADPDPLLSRVKTLELQPGTFVWIAAETHVARSIRNFLAAERGYPRGWIKAGGYWAMGEANAHERLD